MNKHLVGKVAIILSLASGSLFLGASASANSCLCTTNSVYCPIANGCETTDCYQVDDTKAPPTDQAACDKLGQEKSEPTQPTFCYFKTTDNCDGEGTLVSADTIACGGEQCTKSDKVCAKDDDCAQLGGRYLCYNKLCYFDATAQSASQKFSVQELHPPLPEFHLPGLSFSSVTNTLDSEGYIHLPYIGELVAALYKFGMVVGSIIAAVMIIVSGMRIIMSAGGEDKVAAYKRIGEIVVGLMIMWGSYAILYTINPDLVTFKALKIKYIEKTDLDASVAGSEKPSGTAGSCGGAGGGQQTLASDLGLSGALFPYARYSTKYGDTCKQPATIKGIVLHYTITGPTDSARGIVKDWSSPQSPGVICQIIVDLKGQAYQVTEKLDEHVICQGGSSGFQFNSGGIGIEIMGMNESDLLANTAQKQAVIELVKKIAAKYNIEKSNKVDNLLNTASGNGIFTHKQITHCEGAPNLKEDPGENYAKQIIEGAGGTYTDWQSDPRCQK